MPYPRAELEEMVQKWLDTNKHCEEIGDWRPLAELFTEDATYGWNLGPNGNFMCIGRDQIRDIALAQEMGGLDGWTYPYQEVLIDEVKGQVVGFWKQIADAKRTDGSDYEVQGIGGSWFRYAGNFQWSWQRDFFDHINAGTVFGAMMKNNQLKPAMIERMQKGSKMPGWVRRSEFDWYQSITDREA